MLKSSISEWRNIAPETRPVEIFSCAVALWWTELLLLPVNLFHTNALFLGLERHGDEGTWAIATGIVGCCQIAGWCTGIPMLRWTGLWFAFYCWLYIAASVAVSSPVYHTVVVNTGFGVYSLIAAMNVWAMLRIAPFLRVDAELQLARIRSRHTVWKAGRK